MKSFTIILFLTLSSVVFSQSRNEVLRLLETTKEKKGEFDYDFTLDADNELQLLLSNSFVFYKKFVSSQDMGNCAFNPSCSVYAISAIRNQGLVFGLINFFDRYARCHPFSNQHYEKDKNHRLLIDPVRNIKYEYVH